MNQARKQGLLKRLRRLSGPNNWDWEDRDLVVEILDALIEEVFRDESIKAREAAVDAANQEIIEQMRRREEKKDE